MPGLVPGIHAWVTAQPQRKTWIGRDEPGHDRSMNLPGCVAAYLCRFVRARGSGFNACGSKPM